MYLLFPYTNILQVIYRQVIQCLFSSFQPVGESLHHSPPPASETPDKLDPPEEATSTDTTVLVPRTHNPELHKPPAFVSEGNDSHGELLASAHLQFQEEEPHVSSGGDTEENSNNHKQNSSEIFE